MNIYEIQERSGISLRVLRKLDDMGVLKCSTVEKIADDIHLNLRKGNPLSVAQLWALIENPVLLDSLGKLRDYALTAIEALDDYRAEAAPREVVLHILDAAWNDQCAIEKILPWLKSVIPANCAVPHHYLAIRLIMGSSPLLRQCHISKLRRVMANCRAHPEFVGWWSVNRQNGRDATWYSRPKIEYDL